MSGTRERIGVLGGTFDPPHIGHLLAAVNVRSALNLDRVLLVVANEPWQKVGTREISPAEDRLAMVEAAVGDLDRIEASDLEIARGGPSFSVETLEALRSGHPGADLFLIVGADAVGALHTWERATELPHLATLVLVDRPGVQADDPPAGWPLERVEIPRVEVSSTDLRSRVGEGRPLDFLIPPAVATCIAERRLYGLSDS
jgi:nicotinate-nucleotide adenylyltransferase